MNSMLGPFVEGWRSERLRRNSSHREAFAAIPDGLYAFWSSSASREFKGIPNGKLFFARAAEGLLDFFDCVTSAKLPCALPSLAADSVWHAWIQFAPRELEHFCVKHFGRVISHIESTAFASHKDAALATCLVQARRAESMPALGGGLPRLFKLDGELKMPFGDAYRVAGDRIVVHRLDHSGRPLAAQVELAALAPLALLDAGLVTQDEYLDYERRKDAAASSDGGNATDTSSHRRDSESDSPGEADGGSDGGGSDGGGDGGDGGGGGCGGGCGGS